MNYFRIAPVAIAALLIGVTGCKQYKRDDSAPAPVANAITTVKGVGVSEEVFAIYARNRTRQEPDTLSDEQRADLIKELQDLYLLSELAREQKLDRAPEVVAQLDFQRRSVLAGSIANDFLENNEASEDEVRAEYEKMTSGDAGTEYKARHILVETQEEAQAIIGELDGGADFATLATEKSTGPSGPSGGDLGWFPPNRMVKPFSDAVVALEDSAYTAEPVETQFGWHVILREGSRDATPPPFDTMKDQIKPQLEQQKFRDFIEAEREKAGLGS
ncbi:MAG: peptidylprolyl isomerase [Pseudomonadota bacterium]